MGRYAYRAYTTDGKNTKGMVEALSDQEAKEKIRALNLILIDLKEQLTNKGLKHLTKDNLIIFTSQLSQLVTAKIPLYESLLALEEQARGEPYHPLILAIGEKIKTGSSLSKALQEFPESFSPLYRALISAGEAIGNLELALSRLSSLLSYQRKMSKQLMSALTYPLFLGGLMIVALGVLIGFVLPSLEVLFEGRELPWFTACVFSVSHGVQHYWAIFVIALISGGLYVHFLMKKQKNKATMQKILLRIPVVNKYIIHAAMSRFGRTLATLIDGGLPLANALQFATEALHNARLEEILTKVTERVIEGKTISGELSRYKEIPSLFSRMVKIGEESGKLSPMLNQISAMYEEETERTLTRLVSLAQPILLIVMGAVIGAVILSILLPLSDFGSGLQM
jgi:type II secretory pathway component PulF